MNRTLLLAGPVAAATAFLLVGTANAGPPLPYPEPTAPFVLAGTDTAGPNGYCSFPVQVEYVARQHYRQTTLSDGTIIQHIEGYASITVTNTKTGKALTYNASGPGTVTVHPDGSFSFVAHGTNLFYTTVANSAPGAPQLEYATGHITVSVAASGLTTTHSIQGTSTDACAALA